MNTNYYALIHGSTMMTYGNYSYCEFCATLLYPNIQAPLQNCSCLQLISVEKLITSNQISYVIFTCKNDGEFIRLYDLIKMHSEFCLTDDTKLTLTVTTDIADYFEQMDFLTNDVTVKYFYNDY